MTTQKLLKTSDGFKQIREAIQTPARARQFYKLARTACQSAGYCTPRQMDDFGKSQNLETWQEWVLFGLSQIAVALGDKWTNSGTTEEEKSQGHFFLAGDCDRNTDLTKADLKVSEILAKLNN